MPDKGLLMFEGQSSATGDSLHCRQQQLQSYVHRLPFDAETKRRISMTVSCPDTESIPKVHGAGETLEDHGHRVQRMHNGIKVVEDCYYGKWMTELIRLLKGHHEPQEEKVFHEILRYLPAKATMVELGSFWAYYSLWFQQAVEQASTFMIEPDPHNLEVGQLNFKLNGRSGAFFNFSIAHHSGSPEAFKCESDGVVRLIPRISLDDFLGQNRIDYVDLLLADVQGAELQMLHGAQNSIVNGKLRFVLISTHHHSISGSPLTHQHCLQLLRSYNAHIVAEHTVSESYSGDGLIAASFAVRDREIPPIAISRNRACNSLFGEVEFELADAQRSLAFERENVAKVQAAFNSQSRDLESIRNNLTNLQDAVSGKDEVISRLVHSTSWRVTRPVRFLGRTFRAVKSGMRRPSREHQNKSSQDQCRGTRARFWNILSRLPEHNLSARTEQGRFFFSNKDREIGRQLFLNKNFDFDKIRRVQQLLAELGYLGKNTGYLVDVGANIGTVCIPLVRSGGFSQALAFEPAPRNYSLLVKNIRQNGLSGRIRAFDCAVSSAEGMLEMELSGDNYGDHRIRTRPPSVANEQFTESSRRVIRVRARGLDDILAGLGLTPQEIGLLWLDVQGHEQQVMAGARRVIERGTPVVAEFWPYGLARTGISADELTAFVCQNFQAFYDLSQSPAIRKSSSELPALFNIYQGVSFTDLLLLNN